MSHDTTTATTPATEQQIIAAVQTLRGSLTAAAEKAKARIAAQKR